MIDLPLCDDDQLLSILGSDCDCIQADEMLEHVEQCERCQRRLDEMAADESEWLKTVEVLSSPAGEASSDRPRRSGHRLPHGAWTESMSRQLLSPPPHPELLGRIGRYHVERLIGSGGMGVVFKAYDTELNRPVAVKLLAPYLASSGAARNRFAREARAAAAVVDEHVVAIHNVETEGEHPFLVMRYVAGGSLQQRIDRDGPLEVCEVLRIGMQTAHGLAAAHAQGLIHRDVKPSNILLAEGVERALLTDFGLARATDDASLTRSGFHPGTPHYMSPEQVRGDAIDARSDLFGLGCVLYALCTGHPPFRSETSYAVLRRIIDDTPRSIREINPSIPLWLEQIVMKLLAKSPDDRFASAEQVAELLKECLAHAQHPSAAPLPACLSQAGRSRPVASLAAVFGIRRCNTSPMSRGDFRKRWPPIGKLIVAAGSGLAVIFAGVLIVLELQKGTLTIESDLPGVPIRIMQGDKVYERLTVTKGAKSVRIAAGDYVVEIDGPFDGVTVKDGRVTLGRGESEIVRLRQSTDMSKASPVKSDPKSPAKTHPSFGMKYEIQYFSDGPEFRMDAAPDIEISASLPASQVQVFWEEPRNSKVVFAKSGLALVLPRRVNLSAGVAHQFSLSGAADDPQLRLTGSLELAPLNEKSRTYVAHNAIPIQVTRDDIEHCSANNLVVKAIYMPTLEDASPVGGRLETLASTRLDPGLDPIEEARRRGELLGVLRLFKSPVRPGNPAVDDSAPTAGAIGNGIQRRLSDRAKQAVALAEESARKHKRGAISLYLLEALLRDRNSAAESALRELAEKKNVRMQDLIQQCGDLAKAGDASSTVDWKQVMSAAESTAKQWKHSYIGTEHLLMALMTENTRASQFLRKRGIEANAVSDMLNRMLFSPGPRPVKAIPGL